MGIATAAQPETHPDAANTVRCTEVSFSRSAELKRIDEFRNYIHPDARFIGREVLRGPKEIVAGWEPFFAEDGPSIRWRPRVVEMLERGDIARTTAPYLMTSVGEDSQRVEEWGTFSSLWLSDEQGDWKMAFDVGVPGYAPPSASDRALLEETINNCE